MDIRRGGEGVNANDLGPSENQATSKVTEFEIRIKQPFFSGEISRNKQQQKKVTAQ